MSAQQTAPNAGHLPPFKIAATCSNTVVRDILEEVFDRLCPLCLEQEDLSAVELVLAEVLNNVLEHAYAYPEMCGPICVAIEHSPRGLHFTILDKGRAMPQGRKPLGDAVKTDVALNDLPEGGFGWFLIENIAHDVCYHRSNGENKLALRMSVATDLPI